MNNLNESGMGIPENNILTKAKLNKNQLERYDSALPIYKNEDTTVRLVSYVEPRGRNNWSDINDRIESVIKADRQSGTYNDALYDNFEIGHVYDSSEIIGTVSQVRRDLGMKSYASRLKQNCENDLFKLFIMHDVYNEVEVDGKIKKVHVGLKPVFKLQPED